MDSSTLHYVDEIVLNTFGVEVTINSKTLRGLFDDSVLVPTLGTLHTNLNEPSLWIRTSEGKGIQRGDLVIYASRQYSITEIQIKEYETMMELILRPVNHG